MESPLLGPRGRYRLAAAAGRVLLAAGAFLANGLSGATLSSYYAHAAVQDSEGVIAPWYQGLNGQLDERVNIAVNVYKRYPWVDKPKAVMAAPDFIYNSHWSISPTAQSHPSDHRLMCGDLPRTWASSGLTAYYQYRGPDRLHLHPAGG
jgi:hypothetical protein